MVPKKKNNNNNNKNYKIKKLEIAEKKDNNNLTDNKSSKTALSMSLFNFNNFYETTYTSD
jgi:hypothetical protein